MSRFPIKGLWLKVVDVKDVDRKHKFTKEIALFFNASLFFNCMRNVNKLTIK